MTVMVSSYSHSLQATWYEIDKYWTHSFLEYKITLFEL